MDPASEQNRFESENAAAEDYSATATSFAPSPYMSHQNQFINPTQFQFLSHFPHNIHGNLGPGYGFQSMMSAAVSSTQPQSFPPPQTQSHVYPSQAPDVGNQSKKKRKSNPSTTQSANPPRRIWTTEEDTALVKAYLYISVDAIIGREQSGGTMWNRILKVWRENMGTYDEDRNPNALSCRWGIIQAAVNKFHGHYESLNRNPKSGTSIELMKSQALKMYKTLEGTTFRFEHCWEVMRKNPKWCSQKLTKPGSSKKDKPVDVINLDTLKQPITSTEGSEDNKSEGVPRPDEGRKLSKENAKKAHEQKGVIGFLTSYQSTIEKQNVFSQKELELKIEKERKEFELMKEDLALKKKAYELKEEARKKKEMIAERIEEERILNKDLDKMQPVMRKAYKIIQARILKKWKEDGTLGNDSESSDDSL